MSQAEEILTTGISLVSGSSGLQVGLVAKLISEEMSMDCTIYNDVENVPKDSKLVLIDCSNQDHDQLTEVAKGVQRIGSEKVAGLLNAEYESEHENLLDWPCIMGLFYVDTDQDQLVSGLTRLLDGDYWVPRRLLHHFLDRNRRAPDSIALTPIKLTKRERQILKLIKDAATNADISAALKVSEHTVKSHLYNVYKKIGVRNRLEAGNWVRKLDDLDSF